MRQLEQPGFLFNSARQQLVKRQLAEQQILSAQPSSTGNTGTRRHQTETFLLTMEGHKFNKYD